MDIMVIYQNIFINVMSATRLAKGKNIVQSHWIFIVGKWVKSKIININALIALKNNNYL